jgi:hypothetical protein
VDDAQLRPALEEDALAGVSSLEHRCRTIGKVGLDYKRCKVTGLGLRQKASASDCLLQCPENRQLDRHIPLGGATLTRVPAPVVRMDRQREYFVRTH